MEELYQVYLKHPQICTDTRKLIKGGLFFALRGPNFNANEYAQEALNKGCSAAVVDDENLQGVPGYFYVENSLQALQSLANYHRKHLSIPCIGITGSNGKTTTKELIAAVLGEKFKVAFTQGNLNNHIGVPLTLLSIRPEHEIAIIEMGANHQGEIAFLSSIAEPNFGMITNIGDAHLEGFGGREGVIKGKSELYDFLRLNAGKAFVHANDEVLMRQSQSLVRTTYGSDADFTYTVDRSRYQASIVFNGKQMVSKLVGAYNGGNIAAACTIGYEFGVSMDSIEKAIKEYEPGNHRSQWVETERNCVILDAYNANPSSMTSAIEDFAAHRPKNPLLILGDMFELGEESKVKHQEIVDLANRKGLEVLLAGGHFKACNNAAKSFETTEELSDYLRAHPVKDRTILLKGSRGMKLETLMDLL